MLSFYWLNDDGMKMHGFLTAALTAVVKLRFITVLHRFIVIVTFSACRGFPAVWNFFYDGK